VKRKIISLALAVAMAIGVFAVAVAAAEAKPTASTVYIEFKLDGTAKISANNGQWQTASGTYKVSDGKIEMMFDGAGGGDTSGPYKISGDALDLDGDKFTRVPEKEAAAILSDIASSSGAKPAGDWGHYDDPRIIGEWYSQWDGNAAMVFYEDGTCIRYYHYTAGYMKDARAHGYYSLNNGVLSGVLQWSSAIHGCNNYWDGTWGPWGSWESFEHKIEIDVVREGSFAGKARFTMRGITFIKDRNR